MKTTTFRFSVLLLCCATLFASPSRQAQPASARDQSHTSMLLVDEVRHQLVMISNYGVFDWLEAELQPDHTIVLRGQVTRPTTRTDAVNHVKKVEGIGKIEDQIEVLPLSPSDDAIRLATYRAIFKNDSLLTQYALRALPPIHIIVNNGHVALKGVVFNEVDHQLVVTAAKGVPGVFEVKDELQVEKSA